ncbi:hypothetical protein AB0C69_28510 [Actinomadura sp. NPDC048032]|uniref:hypothetical protein n=1 Tax=Actinomadura sp. NPDC048032 TaxID=3155747 RepID=UPI0033F47230
MTAAPIERFTRLTQGDLVWEFASTDAPGECDHYTWCTGPCAPLKPGALGAGHGRYIASALREPNDLVEVCVTQWKANPSERWTVGFSGGGHANLDREPLVLIAAYPPDLDQTKRVHLKPSDAETVALALRMVGHDQFADALDAAATFARHLKEKK